MYNLIFYGNGKLTSHQLDVYQRWLIWRKFKLLPHRYTDDKNIYWNDLVDFACLDEFVTAKQESDRRDAEYRRDQQQQQQQAKK